MSVRFTYFGGMCVLLERSDGFRILVDPFLTGNPAAKTRAAELYGVDLLVVTHAAFDHYGDTAEIMKHSNVVLLAGGEVVRRCERELGEALPEERRMITIYGDERVFGATKVRTVLAFHCSNTVEEGITVTSMPFGFVIEAEPGVVYYHTGDTCIFSDMKLIRELYKPNVMCAGISGISEIYPCEMVPREAALAVSWVGPDVVIPTHYPPGSPALGEFIGHMKTAAPSVLIREQVEKPFVYTPFAVD